MRQRRARWIAAAVPLLLGACGALRPSSLPVVYRQVSLPRGGLAAARSGATGGPVRDFGPNLITGSPGIAINSPAGTAVTLAPVSGGYEAVFGSGTANLPQVGQLGDWVGYALPGLRRGGTYTFSLQVRGSGQAYLDVWNGAADLVVPAVTLTPAPQTLAMTVVLPSFGLAAGNATAQLQVRTHVFPTSVTFRAAVYAATRG